MSLSVLRRSHISRSPAPFDPELCPQGAPMKCSTTYSVTQADVDSGERSNTVRVTSGSPDGKVIHSTHEKTVTVAGSAAVTIGEACARCIMLHAVCGESI